MQHIPSPLLWVGMDTQGVGKGYHGGQPPPQRVIQGSVVGGCCSPGPALTTSVILKHSFLCAAVSTARAPEAAFCTLSSSSPQSSTTSFSRSLPSARNLSCTYGGQVHGSEEKAPTCPVWRGKDASGAMFSDPRSLRALLRAACSLTPPPGSLL